jgi:ATP phosphoribosyltransferase
MASSVPVGAGGASGAETEFIHLALPKGHMQENVFKLLEEAGIKVSLNNARGYRPSVPLPNYDCKLLKPQNILGMLDAGVRDLGFAGSDWMTELGIEGLVEVLDTGLDPVRIVAAGPDPTILSKGVGAGGRKLIVASEYSGLTKRWLAAKGIEAHFLRAYGATEALPPEDADIIVDNAATGSTLKANALEILDTLMHSTTRLYASKQAWANPAKRARIQELVLLLKAVLEARKRLMVSFNLPVDKLDQLGEWLPR